MKKASSLSGILVFGLVLVALIAVVVVGIELTRRQGGAPGTQSQIPPEPAGKPFPRELTDAQGEKLVIPEPPKRIVSQTLATDEILLTICSTERIFAVSELADDPNYSNVVELANAIPERTTKGAEHILQLEPDLIFVASYSRAEMVELLKASRAPVFRFANFTAFEEIKANIRTVGYATGCDAEAEKLVTKMEQDLSALAARVPLMERPLRVMSYGGGYTAGRNTTFDDIVRAVGAVNVSAENQIDGVAKISSEKLAEWKPDFIVAGANTADIEKKRKQMLADPVIASTPAGKMGNVIVIDNRYYLAVSHFVVRAVEALFSGLYGNANAK
ncbi:MAG: ABC transporter substrate-binding protein [Pyrinomonadaceae bacterium]